MIRLGKLPLGLTISGVVVVIVVTGAAAFGVFAAPNFEWGSSTARQSSATLSPPSSATRTVPVVSDACLPPSGTMIESEGQAIDIVICRLERAGDHPDRSTASASRMTEKDARARIGITDSVGSLSERPVWRVQLSGEAVGFPCPSSPESACHLLSRPSPATYDFYLFVDGGEIGGGSEFVRPGAFMTDAALTP
jgi:hypothetical protein